MQEPHNDLLARIDDWADYYNNDRYQWNLALLSPNEYARYLESGVYPLKRSTPSGLQLDTGIAVIPLIADDSRVVVVHGVLHGEDGLGVILLFEGLAYIELRAIKRRKSV